MREMWENCNNGH